MTLRTMLGIGWSILVGLAGGWLVLMPWALNVQGNGDWTDVTKGAFWTGLALLAVCAIGLAVTIGLVVRALTPQRSPRPRQAAETRDNQAELDRALLQIASKLAADLSAPTNDRGNGAVNPTANGTGNGQTAAPATDHEPVAEGEGVSTHRGAER